MDAPVIEELDANEHPGPYDAQLEAILKDKDNDAIKFLSATFAFLKAKTAFFEREDASKQLARLLKEVKPSKAANKAPVANGHASKPNPPAPKASTSAAAAAPPASKPAPAAAPPAQAAEASSSEAGPSEPSSAQPEVKEVPSIDADDDEDESKKGLKPNIGNGYDYEKYSFVQTLKDATASFQMPKGTKGRDCDVKLTATSLRVGLKGQEPIVDGPLHETIKVADSGWSLADGTLDVLLMKENKQNWWKTIMKGDKEINTQKVQPENSKLSDLDPETAAWVEKVQYDNHRKQLGLPTSEEQQKQDKLKDFMKAHPEMDFSKVKFS